MNSPVNGHPDDNFNACWFIKLLQCLTPMIIGLAIAIRLYHAVPDKSTSPGRLCKGKGEGKPKENGGKWRWVNAAFDGLHNGSPRNTCCCCRCTSRNPDTRFVLYLTLIKFPNYVPTALLIRHVGLAFYVLVLEKAKAINLHHAD